MHKLTYMFKVGIGRSHKGFALASSIVTSFIIMVILTLTIANIRQYQPKMKLTAVSRELAMDLRYAQQRTITEQIPYVVTFDILGGDYSILKVDSGTTTIETISLPGEISFDSITGLTNEQVWFNSYGAVKDSGIITLMNTSGDIRNVNVKPSGYIQLN